MISWLVMIDGRCCCRCRCCTLESFPRLVRAQLSPPLFLRRASILLLAIFIQSPQSLFSTLPYYTTAFVLHQTPTRLPILNTAIMADVDTPPVQEATATDQNPLANMEVTDAQALVPTNPDAAALEPKKKTKKIMVKKKRRPARVQQEGFQSERPAQTGTIFNIWYNKWSGGDREDAYSSKQQAKGRCNVALDSGYTQADSIAGSYFCLFFARGLCPKGQDCEYLHRLPNSRVEKEGGLGDIFPSNVDCFGRDKFSDYRDDMGGVGSFMRVNRTLYVGRIHTSDDIEEVVARHFQEWGQIERVRVLPARGVAFVTYVHLANAVSHTPSTQTYERELTFV